MRLRQVLVMSTVTGGATERELIDPSVGVNDSKVPDARITITGTDSQGTKVTLILDEPAADELLYKLLKAPELEDLRG